MNQQNEQINLRAIEPEDIDLLYQWENDRSIWLVSNTITPFSRYILTKYIENSHLDIYQTKQLRLMIDVNENEQRKTVGSIDLFDFDPTHLRAGIGVLIGSEQDRGKGYAKLALNELIQFAFETLHLHQLYCNISADNLVSKGLFEHCGFKIIGIKKDWNKTKTGYADEILMQRIDPRKP